MALINVSIKALLKLCGGCWPENAFRKFKRRTCFKGNVEKCYFLAVHAEGYGYLLV